MRNILLSVIGLTPQVLTETIYYYAVVSQPSVAFDEIQIITTKAGRDKILTELLAQPGGKFHALCRDYNLSDIKFDETCIHVVGKDRPLDDIRSIQDNGEMADTVQNIVRALTSDPSVAIYCSIAGGRKTMSSYLALALQLYGRPQDRLSHVLVSPEFEACRDFYYPTPENTALEARDSRGNTITVQTKDAKIELAEIPFVRLRRYLPKKKHFVIDEIDRNLQACLDGPMRKTDIRLDLGKSKLRISDTLVRLQPKELAVYAFFAILRKGCKTRGCKGWEQCSISLKDMLDEKVSDKIFRIYRDIAGHGQFERVMKKWRARKPEDRMQYFLETISKVNAKLRRTVSELDYPFVEISAEGGYGEKRYGIRLDKKQIQN